MEKLHFAFPCAVNRVIHGEIASYAHFHDADFKYLKSFAWAHIIMLTEVGERMIEDVRIYVLPGSSEKVGRFRKTSTKTLRGKPHTGCFKNRLYVADTEKRGKTRRWEKKSVVL